MPTPAPQQWTRDLDSRRLRRGEDGHHRADAADDRRVRLGDVVAARRHAPGKLARRRHDLAARDGHAEALPQPGQAADVLRPLDLLEKPRQRHARDTMRVEKAGDGLGRHRGRGEVLGHVDGNGDARRRRRAPAPDGLRRLMRPRAYLEETGAHRRHGRDLLAHPSRIPRVATAGIDRERARLRAAQRPPQRHAERPGARILQRDLDRRDDMPRRPLGAPVAARHLEVAEHRRKLGEIASDHQRREQLGDRHEDLRRENREIAFAETDDAGVRDDLDQSGGPQPRRQVQLDLEVAFRRSVGRRQQYGPQRNHPSQSLAHAALR